MVNIQQILPESYWTGASDRRLSRFENLFPLPNGVSGRLDFTVETKEEARRVLDAFAGGQAPAGPYTRGLYTRGVK